MKKVIILFLLAVSALHAYAQKVDSLQVQSQPVTIDSLCLRLNKLQHDYNFMYCDYELHKLITDLKDLSSSIDISSNGAIIDYYNGSYNSALYDSFTKNYDSNCAMLDSLKEKIEVVKLAVLVIMNTSDFSEQEQNVIYGYFNLIQKCVTKVERSIDYFDVAIQAYKSKRW